MEEMHPAKKKTKVGRIRHPRIVCYRSIEDLKALRRWFYDFDKEDNRRRAVQRVKALASRGKLPHAMESTSLLTAVHLSDLQENSLEGGSDGGKVDTQVLQMSYTMSLIRFVNGFLDPFQQSNYAIPLHRLARNLDLPGFFVELRHMGTHEQLPSMSMLRIACKEALNWLYDHYWAQIEEDAEDDEWQGLLEEHSENEIAKIKEGIARANDTIEAVYPSLKELRRIRKENPNAEYRFGNTSEEGSKYWKCVKTFRKHLSKEEETCTNILIFKCILRNRDKEGNRQRKDSPPRIEAQIRLFKPFLDELGDEYKIKLLKSAMEHVDIYENADLSVEESLKYSVNQKLDFCVKSEHDKERTIELAAALVTDLISSAFKKANKTSKKITQRCLESITAALDQVDLFSLENKYKCYQFIHTTFGPATPYPDTYIKDRISTTVADANKHFKLNEFVPPPSLEDLLGDSTEIRENFPAEKDSSQRKRRKLSQHPGDSYKSFFFESHESWSPTPFGVSI